MVRYAYAVGASFFFLYLTFLSYVSSRDLLNMQPIRAALVGIVDVKTVTIEVVGLNGSNRDRFIRQRSVRVPAKEWTTVANDSRTIIPNEAITDRSRIHIDAYPPLPIVVSLACGQEPPQPCKSHIEVRARIAGSVRMGKNGVP